LGEPDFNITGFYSKKAAKQAIRPKNYSSYPSGWLCNLKQAIANKFKRGQWTYLWSESDRSIYRCPKQSFGKYCHGNAQDGDEVISTKPLLG